MKHIKNTIGHKKFTRIIKFRHFYSCFSVNGLIPIRTVLSWEDVVIAALLVHLD